MIQHPGRGSKRWSRSMSPSMSLRTTTSGNGACRSRPWEAVVPREERIAERDRKRAAGAVQRIARHDQHFANDYAKVADDRLVSKTLLRLLAPAETNRGEPQE